MWIFILPYFVLKVSWMPISQKHVSILSVENQQEPPQAVYTPPVPLSSALTPRGRGSDGMGWPWQGDVCFGHIGFHQLLSDFMSHMKTEICWKIGMFI